MNKFILRLLLFSLLFFVYDKLFLLYTNYAPQLEVDKRLELVINGEINKDIVIMGSSRGARNIIAVQMEKESGFETYNLSYPGSNIEFHEFLLRTLLDYDQKPKLIVLAVDDPLELSTSMPVKFRLDRLYPLVKYECVRKEMVKRGEKNEWLEKLLVLYRLNKSNFDLRKKKFTNLDSILPCGSMPISFQRKGRKFIFEQKEVPYNLKSENKQMVDAFTRFIDLCRKNNIKLLLAFSPNYKTPSSSFEKRMKDLAGKDAYYFKYDTSVEEFKKKDFFYDEFHLQKNGAIIFTSEVSAFIKDSVGLKK